MRILRGIPGVVAAVLFIGCGDDGSPVDGDLGPGPSADAGMMSDATGGPGPGPGPNRDGGGAPDPDTGGDPMDAGGAEDTGGSTEDTGGGTTDDTGTTPDTSETANPLPHLPSPTLPARAFEYDIPLPAHLQDPAVLRADNTPGDNAITNAGATLGRVLFYDRRLSANGEVSCASCHEQASSFGDPRELSVGFEGELTGRHSMALVNLRYYPSGAMFWDERADTLEDQVLMPIQDLVEMGMTLDELVVRLSATDYYGPLFEDAFGDPEVTEDRISRALAQFVRSIVSFDSRFDAEVAAVGDVRPDFPGFSAQENRGKDIFFGEHDPTTRGLCGSCHMFANPTLPGGGPGPAPNNLGIFHQIDPTNNGLGDPDDLGVGGVTGLPQNNGQFKTSSLRNIALTGPYMHDGRFDTLEEVVRHYNQGIQFSDTLAPQLTTPPMGPGSMPMPIRLGLSRADQDALVAFLETLTDTSVTTDERWSDPFGATAMD